MAHEVLFCPFCGEAFEGEARCPAHDLALVPWSALPKQAKPIAEDEALPWWSAGFGRGALALGAALALLAFAALPLARVEGDLRMGGTMLALALSGTHKLWLVPTAAWAQLAILYRRRTPRAMRGARLAAALIACVPAIAAAWTWDGAAAAVRLLAERTHEDLVMRAGEGAYVLALSFTAMMAGAVRFGVPPRRRAAPLTPV